MEFIAFILILVAAAIVVLPIVAIVTAKSNARDLREEMAATTDKIRDLESQVNRLVRESKAATVAPATPSPIETSRPYPSSQTAISEAPPPEALPVIQPLQPQHPASSVVAPPPIAAFTAPQKPAEPIPPVPMEVPSSEPAIKTPQPIPAPKFATFEIANTPTASERAFSLEERLGANWLNKIGIAILVIGLAFFLAYKLQTWGPAGKVLCGFAISTALLGGGIWLERKPTYRIFACAGIGGGWALAFFTTFAMHHIDAARIRQSLVVDLVLMLLVAAGMVAHSLRYRSQTVTGLAFLLGFFTLLTSHMQATSGTVVFSLLASAILAIALVVVTTRRHWAVLEVAGLLAVYATHFAWLTQVLPENHAAFTEFWPSTALILLYWFIFRVAYVFRTPLSQNEENLSSLAAVLNSGGVLSLLKYQSAHPDWAFWALVALGAVEMALAFIVRSRRRQAFVVLSTIATVLLVAAVPFRFHGVSWPVLWLVEAQVLALCGLRLGEPVFRRLGLLAGILTGAVLAAKDVAPLALFRLDYSDPARHISLAVALALAAILYWIHAELYPRRWPQIAENYNEAFALRATSWLGLAAAAAALWVVLPASWVVVGWLALVIVLGGIADWARIVPFALQADTLTLAALLGLYNWNLWNGSELWSHKFPLASAVILLYAGMRRKTVAEGSPSYVAPAYSWLATLLLAFVALDQASIVAFCSAWAVLGLTLFEVGCFTRKNFLRWQGFLLIGFAFARYLAIDLLDSSGAFHAMQTRSLYAAHFSLTRSLLLEVLVLAVAGYWLMERTRNRDHSTQREHIAGIFAHTLGTLSIVLWLALRLPSYWVPAPGADLWVNAIWAAMAAALLTLALFLRRTIFLAQSVALVVAVVLRGLIFDLFASSAGTFWHRPLVHISVDGLILLAALPFAFQLRKQNAPTESSDLVRAVFARPEQWFFFAPFSLMVIALAVKLSSGHITIAWSITGVAVFLFALVVGERSYRLAGLALLLVSVVKILLMDVWALAPSDRYTTLIVLGLALLGVSFLYTRFSSVIRKYL